MLLSLKTEQIFLTLFFSNVFFHIYLFYYSKIALQDLQTVYDNCTYFIWQYVAGGIVLITVSMTLGTMFGFSAILLPQLEDENIMKAKSDEASWVGKKVLKWMLTLYTICRAWNTMCPMIRAQIIYHVYEYCGLFVALKCLCSITIKHC